MKLTAGVLFLAMTQGAAWGQNPDVISDTRSTMKALQQKQAIDTNAALAASPAGTPKASAAAPKTVQVKSSPAVTRKASAATPKAVAVRSSPRVASKLPAKPKAAKKAQPRQQISVADQKKPAETKPREPQPIKLTGRRDPFVSPVVNRSMLGSGCSVGKRCLYIDQINLKGVVKSDNGMIAVVTNSLNKAYFLRENDPVFNGYVVRITGDSIVFKETLQDRLGKPLTREVTKKITTSAV